MLCAVKFWVEELFENEPACDVYIVGTKGIKYILWNTS